MAVTFNRRFKLQEIIFDYIFKANWARRIHFENVPADQDLISLFKDKLHSV